ncbi:MAG: hypothetical protein ACI8R4_000373 [Paracoccaceae bacterium]|jgi:hypothetical protein
MTLRRKHCRGHCIWTKARAINLKPENFEFSDPISLKEIDPQTDGLFPVVEAVIQQPSHR